MAKQEQTIKNNNLNKNNNQPGIKTDLVNILIGMVVMILFIAGLVFLIGALLR
jgi:hypothetical protein